MNLVFTCGGTAGHINPAIAIAGGMRRRHPDCKVLFIGAEGHMEEKLVPQAGFELKTLPGSGLSRKKNLAGLKQNVHAVNCVFRAVRACKEIFKEFRPDVIIGTGGYASFPALYAGSKMGIPTCVHESNAVPGVTTKMIAKHASRVLVAFEESVSYYDDPGKVEVVGMPVQQGFIFNDKKQAREQLGLTDEFVVLSAFGSLGAKHMNEIMAELFCLEKEAGYPFHHIHATGGFGWEWMPELVEKDGVDLPHTPSIDMREYIYDMPVEMAAADVVISRSGAATCNEIAASGTPSILIPSPNVTNNHQEHNARVLSNKDAAVTILEKDCTAQGIFDEIQALLKSPERRENMSKTLRTMARLDSTERICDIVEELTKG
ncbi:MAG: UDP-N-acetylglucosamine--N-acetylmuramyl-(pentapeptide) pyrophosphoryl-undecaprenol N-acetylglucosamine transferase [Candidatus Faecousia sp.]|nr:UDP-N-acetylglucosamine--N-acetylmuramyl-(pentapeptide) pyrophosphoryl-undecaprenol N-acetylglucosamine transferase [Candidatus Faecousia sp.]